MAPGVWNGKDTWLVVEVCSGVCVCVCVCVCGDPGSRIPIFFFSSSNSSDAESWEGEWQDKCRFVYLLIGAVPSGRAVAASLDGTHSLSSVWLACWCSQRHKGTFWWVLWDPPITCFFEVGSSLMASFSYFPEVHNLLFLESSYLVGCSLGSGIDKILPRCALRGYHRQWEIYTFLYKGDIEAASLPSFCPAIFLSQLSYLSAAASGQINISVGLSGQQWDELPVLLSTAISNLRFTEILKER